MQNRNLKACMAFFDAISSGNIKSIQAMLGKGLNINMTSPIHDQNSPLHYAALHGQAKMVELLLSQGADEKALNGNMQTAIEAACERRHLKVAKAMIDYLHKANRLPSKEILATCLSYAAVNGDIEIMTYLLKQDVHPDTTQTGKSPALHLAAGNGQTNAVTTLLNAGANIELVSEKSGDTALCTAIRNEKYTAARILLKHGANPDAKRKSSASPTPLAIAINQNLADMFDLLLEHGADPDAAFSDQTPLAVKLVLKNYPTMMQSLIKNNHAVSAVDADGKNALHHAAALDDELLTRLLCTADIDIHARDKNGKSPLAFAVYKNACLAAATLLANGANTNDDAAGTPLITLAINNNSKEAAELLIANGADVNAKNERQETPLFRAVVRESLDLVKALLIAKADPNAVNGPDQDTALVLAIEDEDKVTIKLLLQHGATLTDKALNEAAFNNTFDLFSFLYQYTHPDVTHLKTVCEYMRLLLLRGIPANLILRVLPKFTGDKAIKSLELAYEFVSENRSFSTAILKDFSHAQKKYGAKKPISILSLLNRLLIRAIKKNDIHTVDDLIHNGANVNHVHDQDRYTYYTPLHLAANMGNRHIASVLLTHGADINARNDSEGTPLHEAAISNHTDIIYLLATAGANLNKRNCYDQTVVYMAAMHGNGQALEALITEGADPNVTTTITRSALNNLASKFGGKTADLIDELLQDETKKHFDLTATKIAEIMGQYHVIPMLEAARHKATTKIQKSNTQFKHCTLFACTDPNESDLLPITQVFAGESEDSNCNVPINERENATHWRNT